MEAIGGAHRAGMANLQPRRAPLRSVNRFTRTDLVLQDAPVEGVVELNLYQQRRFYQNLTSGINCINTLLLQCEGQPKLFVEEEWLR